MEAGQALDELPRSPVQSKKGRIERLKARALANSSWGIEYWDETWFVFVPRQGVINPEAGSGWSPLGEPPHNLTSRKKGQETWNAYVGLDLKEQRLCWRYTDRVNQWETALLVQQRLAAHERMGHRTLVLVWDAASWHKARALVGWFRTHNQQVDRSGQGVKIVPVMTPVHAFWLNPVEALIGHAKRRVLPCRQFGAATEQQAALDRHWLQRNLCHARVPSPEDLIATLH